MLTAHIYEKDGLRIELRNRLRKWLRPTNSDYKKFTEHNWLNRSQNPFHVFFVILRLFLMRLKHPISEKRIFRQAIQFNLVHKIKSFQFFLDFMTFWFLSLQQFSHRIFSNCKTIKVTKYKPKMIIHPLNTKQ